jgi:hypothetical protein
MTAPCIQIETIARLDERVKVAEAAMKEQTVAITALTKELGKLRQWGTLWVLLLALITVSNSPQVLTILRAVPIK